MANLRSIVSRRYAVGSRLDIPPHKISSITRMTPHPCAAHIPTRTRERTAKTGAPLLSGSPISVNNSRAITNCLTVNEH